MDYEHQTTWQERASQITETPNPEWVSLLQNNLRRCHPNLVATLAMKGDLDAYLKVVVCQAMLDHQSNLAAGMDLTTANELAMEDLLRPEQPEEAEEDWELEGATADIVAAAEKQLLSPTERNQQ